MNQAKHESLHDLFEDVMTEELQLEAAVDYTLAQVAGRAIRVKEESGLSIREIAQRMGQKSKTQVQRMIDAEYPHNLTLETLARFCFACGFEVDVQLRPQREVTKRISTNERHEQFFNALIEGNLYNAARAARRPRPERREATPIPGGLGGVAITTTESVESSPEELVA